MKLIIIHPGIQHSPYLANGALRSKLFTKVTILTSILYKPHQKVLGLLKKRIKPIDKEVHIVNHYLYALLYPITKFIYNKFFINTQNQSHNNPIYFWQQAFGYLCLPRLYFNRKNLIVVCFETAGWPIVKYCKKWNIPVIMDFASISHEKAKSFGIYETQYGINLKLKERALIAYGFYCSEFCKKSFEGLTSAKKDFVLYLGAEGKKIQEASSKYQDLSSQGSEVGGQNPNYWNGNNKPENSIKLSFIANLEYRKGLDIFLEGIYAYEYPVFLEVHLIGRIREEWVNQHLPKEMINQNIKLIYRPAMSQSELFAYLQKEAFDLNVQCSRFDSFAMVVPETMMQGIPNVVSPFVGAGEMIKDGFNGFIMEELSSKCLMQKIKSFINLLPNEKYNLKHEVLLSSKNMSWENYYRELSKSLNLISKSKL